MTRELIDYHYKIAKNYSDEHKGLRYVYDVDNKMQVPFYYVLWFKSYIEYDRGVFYY